MSGTQSSKYTLEDQHRLANFVNGVIEGEAKPGMVLDSATAAESAIDAANGSNADTPPAFAELLDLATDDQGKKMVKALFDGVNHYEREHGFRPSGDVLLSAVHQGKSIFDSATNGHHDQISLHPNAPVVAILGAMAEATPFAGYLPADGGSNEARLIIVSHQAGSNWGDYSASDLMDGINSGGQYLGSARTMELGAPNDNANYKFAFTTQASGGAALNLLRGRTIVYVNGKLAAQEVQNAPSTAAQVSIVGSVTLDGADYNLTGTVKPGSGEVVITANPTLPKGSVVNCEAFVDYEADASVTPRMAVQANVYSLFAAPFRGIYQITPESRSQFANEVGVDAGAEAMLAVRGQFAMERHYNALAKAKMIGKYNNCLAYDFEWSQRNQQMLRGQIWQDFQALLGTASQKMAEDTADHGITHLYVTKSVLAQFRALPANMWESSGITDRPGIYRAGRLFGLYEVYYSPKVIGETPDGVTAEILAVGRSSQTARCPIIFGDASAPMFEPLGMVTDLKSGYGFHARCFTAMNPHAMSALGAALITVTNLK